MAKGNIILVIITIIILIIGGTFLYDILSPEEIQDPLLKKIKERKEIIIGTDATYPPMESITPEGDFLGMDIDIAKEIASDLGVEAKFRNIAWEEIFDAVIKGEVDMIISSITITPDRSEIMSFSNPYFNAGQVIVVRIDKQEIIKGVEDLQGHTLGVQVETTSEEEAKKYATDSSFVKSYENYELAKEDLMEEEIDAIIIDYPAAVGMTIEEQELQIVGEPFTQEFYGIATEKNQAILLSEINKTIRRLKKEGELNRLEEKWLSQ